MRHFVAVGVESWWWRSRAEQHQPTTTRQTQKLLKKRIEMINWFLLDKVSSFSLFFFFFFSLSFWWFYQHYWNRNRDAGWNCLFFLFFVQTSRMIKMRISECLMISFSVWYLGICSVLFFKCILFTFCLATFALKFLQL